MSTMQKFKESWEYRSVRFLLRIMAYALLFAYLAGSAPSAWRWAHLKWIRFQPLTEFGQIVEKSIAEKNPEEPMNWVLYRSREDRAEIMRILEPHTGKISSFTFIHYAFWAMEEGRGEEAVFWRQYANFRLRYDALRCGSVDGEKDVTHLLETFSDKKIQAVQDADPSLDKKSILWVLEKDAKYPAENYPSDICRFVNTRNKRKNGALVPEDKWAGIRHSLRIVAELRLKEMKD